MLHRMALRVLPSLSLAVTEDGVRKQKRIVMFVPGLVAFAVYRLAKLLLPLSEPIVLLMVSGLVASVTALLTYRIGRGTAWRRILQEDGSRLLLWLGGWIGFVYGVQLSLLVLALLWLVGYDYLAHPDGPAMMAIIISCTAVARDAFEIGHVRKVALMGRPFPTFPDGTALRTMVGLHGVELGPWVAVGLVVGALGASLGHLVEANQGAALVQLSAVAGWGQGCSLCLLWRASSTDVMGPRAVADKGERIAEILVVAWTRLWSDVLSGGGGMCDFPLETAGNSHFLCHGQWRICDRHDGAVLLLSRVSPAGRRTAGTHDVECLAPMSVRHGHS